MTTHELTRDQMVDLKRAYISELVDEGNFNTVVYGNPDADNDPEESDASYGEIADADELIPDEVIHNHYAGVDFGEEDFAA